MGNNSMATAGGKIKITDDMMQGFYKMLEKNNIELDDTIATFKKSSKHIEKEKATPLPSMNTSVIYNDMLYKIRVDDGWLQLDKMVYRKMLEYFNKVEYASVPNFFEETGIRPEKVSRIVDDEKRATIFTEKMSIEIYTYDEYFVLSNYESYKRIDENGNEDPF